MSLPPARCGTDAGYYRHRRITKTEACADCRAAHSAATRRPAAPPKVCACGKRMHPSRQICSACTQKAKWAAGTPTNYVYTDTENDPKRPVAWVRKGYIQVPVYAQSEVA